MGGSSNISGLIVILIWTKASIMKIAYLSPSVLPSRTANSIHVMRMCEAFSELGCEVKLYAHRSVPEHGNFLRLTLERYYGVSLDRVNVIAPKTHVSLALNMRGAVRPLIDVLTSRLTRKPIDLVVSRNLYASYLINYLLKGQLVFETHQVEYGFRKLMQGTLIRSKRTKTVVISKALHMILCNHVNMQNFQPLVLHDAAPYGIKRMEPEEKKAARIELSPSVEWSSYRLVAGYFGHLYSGRGIEIIEELSLRHPEILFLVFGGNKEQIEAFQRKEISVNLKIMGFLKPSIVLRAMGMMDILLMPYQRQVSIGAVKQDTALWMSPIKMFEYMATGVPIVSSRLPVLNEVIRDGENCLMAEPDDPTDWSICIRRLSEDPALGRNLADRAYQDYRERYNWLKRAQQMLELVQKRK